MASRGWENVRAGQLPKRNKGISDLPSTLNPSKYRNVKVVADGYTFDSKAEAEHYHFLKLREKAGDIRGLMRQVPYPLYAPVLQYGYDIAARVVVSTYIADFVYEEHYLDTMEVSWRQVVADKKGKRTQMYSLKRKWMELQYGIVIQEV